MVCKQALCGFEDLWQLMDVQFRLSTWEVSWNPPYIMKVCICLYIDFFLHQGIQCDHYIPQLEVAEPLKGSLSHPKKVAKNCQVYNIYIYHMKVFTVSTVLQRISVLSRKTNLSHTDLLFQNVPVIPCEDRCQRTPFQGLSPQVWMWVLWHLTRVCHSNLLAITLSMGLWLAGPSRNATGLGDPSGTTRPRFSQTECRRVHPEKEGTLR